MIQKNVLLFKHFTFGCVPKYSQMGYIYLKGIFQKIQRIVYRLTKYIIGTNVHYNRTTMTYQTIFLVPCYNGQKSSEILEPWNQIVLLCKTRLWCFYCKEYFYHIHGMISTFACLYLLEFERAYISSNPIFNISSLKPHPFQVCQIKKSKWWSLLGLKN